MSNRNMAPRKMKGVHDPDAFDYPMEHTTEDCAKGIPQIPDVHLGNFPNNIYRWIWSSPGENDGASWEAIFELLDDDEGERFAQQHAWCDQTGFDCQGGVDIIVARDISTLIEQAMGNAAQERYIASTEPVEKW